MSETIGKQAETRLATSSGPRTVAEISIIIATRNRPDHLRGLLVALLEQTLKTRDFEVVVVDDGSNDTRTRTAACCAAPRFASLTYRRVDNHGGLAAARNAGLALASGSKILFIDDDCRPNRDWAQNLARALNDHPVVAGAICSPRTPFARLCHNLAEFHGFMTWHPEGPCQLIAGANMAFRADVLRQAGGFRVSLRNAEDMEVVLRLRRDGIPVHFVPNAQVLHETDRETLRDAFTYAFHHASTTIRLRQEYADVLRTPRVLRQPITILLTAPLLAMAVTLKIIRPRQAHVFWYAAPILYFLKLAWCFGAADGLRRSGGTP